MNRIFQFILKNYFTVLFLVLEVICFIILVQYNHFHKASFLSSSNILSSRVSSTVSDISDYFYLKKANKLLSEENAALRNKEMASFKKIDKNFYVSNDTLYRQRYLYTSAKIINNSVNKRDNNITLDKGRLHGIEPDMGVITHNGVVGIIKNVSNNFSSAISILHKDAKISAKIKKNGYVGSISWQGGNYRVAELLDIPGHVELEEGDTIITSGYSAIFPEGITIGTIKDFSLSEGASSYKIKIELLVDLKSLSYVHVVKNLFRYEQKQLEGMPQNE